MELKQLKSYVAVVEYKSFSKAAEKLFISQPTISYHVSQLEEEFRSRLIVRTTRSIEVTPRGKELYDCAEHILNLLDKLEKTWNDEDTHIIRLGTSTIPSAYILPEVIPAYRKIYPEVQFSIHQNDSQGILGGLLQGRFELGIVGMPVYEETIECTPFFTDTMALITPDNAYYRKWKEIPKGPSLEQIAGEPMLLREQGSGSKKAVISYLEDNGIDEKQLDIVARLHDQESIKNLVAGGLGLSILSKKAASVGAKEGHFLLFDLPGRPFSRNLYLLRRKGFIMREQTRNFAEFMEAFYREQ